MEISFFSEDEIKVISREINEPDHIFDARASFLLTYDDVVMSNIHVNKLFCGYKYKSEIEEKYEMIVGGQNKMMFYTDNVEDIELTDIDLIGDVSGLIFNQYCKINTNNKKIMKVVEKEKQISVKKITQSKYQTVVLYFSFFCVKYISSFFAGINEALEDEGTFIIVDNIFDKVTYKQIFGTLYKKLLGDYFNDDFNPRFLMKREEISGFDLYDIEEIDEKSYCKMTYKKKCFIPTNLTEKFHEYTDIIQFRYATPTNKVEKINNIIYFNLDQKDFRSDKYSEIFTEIAGLIKGNTAFNKKGLEKTLRWEKIYFELKKLAYKLKSIKFIIVSKKNE